MGSSYAQTSDAQEKEREKFVQKQYQEYQNRVNTFVSLLNIDDFKGEILKQKIEDYYKQRSQILNSQMPELEKEPMTDQLLTTFLSDVEELYSENTIISVQSFLKDNKAEIKKLQKNTKTKKNN